MLEVATIQKKLFPETFWCTMMFNPSIRTKTGRVTLENFYSASTSFNFFNTVSCEDMKDFIYFNFFNTVSCEDMKDFIYGRFLINIWKVKDVARFLDKYAIIK